IVVVGVVRPGTAGEVMLTVVNVVTPQDVKIWERTSVFARKGDSVNLKLINRHTDEHGYEVASFGSESGVAGRTSEDAKFSADSRGVCAIKCHLHPAHVVGQLVVLE